MAAPALISEAQLAANRANSQFSTGPRTEAGKSRSSRNASTHGLFSSVEAMAPAERALFDQHLAFFLPYGVEGAAKARVILSTQLALYRYRLDKVHRLEFAYFAERIQAIVETENLTLPLSDHDRFLLEARVFREDMVGAKVLAKLLQYEKLFNREIEKGHRLLNNLSDDDILRQMEACRPSTNSEMGSFLQNEDPSPECEEETAPIPRSAPCPCGSGEKYKRCCGKNAPAVLNL